MLHLIFQSPIDITVLDRMGSGDVAVFLENAVLGLLQKGKFAEALNNQLNMNRLFVLTEDMQVRGLLTSELVSGLEVIDYAGLVDLTVENLLITSWC